MDVVETFDVYYEGEYIPVRIRSIIYILMEGDYANIFRSGEETLRVKMTLVSIEKILGPQLDFFVKVKRGCLVSIFAVHNVEKKVNLGNGVQLNYVSRKGTHVLKTLEDKKRKLIDSFAKEVLPKTNEDFHEYYRVFDTLPIAFTDIEMVFNDVYHAADWVFRYANDALGEIEQIPKEELIGKRFGEVFPNMDDRWLKTYEWATLFEEVLQIVDYSPEIDTNLKIICFPTFKGHCGCILFDIGKLRFFREKDDTDKAISAFVSKLLY